MESIGKSSLKHVPVTTNRSPTRDRLEHPVPCFNVESTRFLVEEQVKDSSRKAASMGRVQQPNSDAPDLDRRKFAFEGAETGLRVSMETAFDGF